MFWSSIILGELVESLAKVTLLLIQSVNLCHRILCGDVAACREMACVLFVVKTDIWFNLEQFHPVAIIKSMSSIVTTPLQPNKCCDIHLFLI